ncbi:ATP-binding protein [Egibacter rhizosphaerae]|uniref:ATP-binding protein n=1 Tax=Egibacter rhizosphaerae TaxID=1670831 RepID=UPI0013F15EA9|nr:ATP-binding protein [Egibacter rhizosphaerae]
MSTATQPPPSADHGSAEPRSRGALFQRSGTDRVLVGVAGGLAARLGVRALLLRIAFVLLATTGPFGLISYAVAWVLSEAPPEDPTEDPARADRTQLAPQQYIGLGLMALGVLVLLREIGLWIGDDLVWPLALAIAGSALIWTRLERRSDRMARAGRLSQGFGGALRLGAGLILVFAGLAALAAANEPLLAGTGALGAAVLTLFGLVLVAGPWALRLARQSAEERRDRIRSEERAEMAAHLHDSVLHTLALIQRTDDPSEAVRLARSQERELRGWLYGGRRQGDALGLSDLVDEMAGRIERHHDVKVEAVVVGDSALDDRLRALIDAAGEAATNAARHAGVETVSVYVEVEPEHVNAFVRDEGCGFDPDVVPADRHGLAESIRGRMRRHGGWATIWSEPGEGTEVELCLPRQTDPLRVR